MCLFVIFSFSSVYNAVRLVLIELVSKSWTSVCRDEGRGDDAFDTTYTLWRGVMLVYFSIYSYG